MIKFNYDFKNRFNPKVLGKWMQFEQQIVTYFEIDKSIALNAAMYFMNGKTFENKVEQWTPCHF